MADEARILSAFEAWDDACNSGLEPNIASICDDDSELIDALRRRIAMFRAIGAALTEDADYTAGDAVSGTTASAAGRTVGKYLLIEEIGEGGFGVVYHAERRDGYSERVALKVLKSGIVSSAARARFAGEAQALAMVRHPNIASVLDTGVTPDGTPYLVMDLISGDTLTSYCERRNLSLQERLRLMLDVCAAVGHAHTKGVIHRDLKPGNILVTEIDEVPVPKVIDFGIARITAPQNSDTPRVTQQNQFLGTAAYMSPEQLGLVDGDPDTRSDIYSLGVILYQLVCGALPYERPDDGRVSPQLLCNRMAASEPKPPSSVVTAQDRSRATTGESSVRELDWLILKCLKHEPEHRYATCKDLSADLDRFLQGHPLEAGPPGAVYRARKFVRRNRSTVAFAGVLAACIAAAASVALTGLVQAARDRERAISAEAATRRVAEFQAEQLTAINIETMGAAIRGFIRDDLHRSAQREGTTTSPMSSADRITLDFLDNVSYPDVARRTLSQEVFDPTVAAITAQFAEEPDIRSRLLLAAGSAQLTVGLLADAESTHRAALEAADAAHGQAAPQTLIVLRELGNTLTAAGSLEDAEIALRQALDGLRDSLGPNDVETLTALNDLGTALSVLGRTEEAAAAFDRVVQASSASLEADHRLGLIAASNLAGELDLQGRTDEADAMYRTALAGFERTLGPSHPTTILAINNIGVSLHRRGRHEDAQPYLSRALALSKRSLGDNHPTTLIAMSNTAVLFESLGMLDESLAMAKEAFDRRRDVLGPFHRATIQAGNTLSGLLRQTGSPTEAAELSEWVVRSSSDLLGPEHWQTGVFRTSLAMALAESGRFDQAAEQFNQAHGVLIAAAGPEDERVRANARAARSALEDHIEAAHPSSNLPKLKERLALWEAIEGAKTPD
jgi:non-specific serine/threonine protein kinase/serine/threonine-protein kinase